MKKNIFIIATAMILFGLQSRAAGTGPGVILNPSFFYFTDKDNNQSGPSTNTTRDVFNIKLGYLIAEGFYVGMAYDVEDKSIKNNSTTTDESRKSYGPTLGYISDGLQFMATYYLNSKFTTSSNDFSGIGWVVDLGYIFNLGNVGIGPMMSYRWWTYSKDSNGQLNPNRTQSNFLPSIELFITL